MFNKITNFERIEVSDFYSNEDIDITNISIGTSIVEREN